MLRQANAAVRQALEDALAPTGLTQPQFAALTILGAYGDLSGAEIARVASLTPQTINVITHNLTRIGAIATEPDPEHGRIVRLSLTEHGKALLSDAKRIASRIERAFTQGLSPAEEATIRTWLVKLAQSR